MIENEKLSLVDYAGGVLTADRHAIVTSAVVNGMGVYHGCEATILNSSTIRLSAGYLTIYGRLVEVFQHDYPVQLATTGTLKGRLYVVLDLDNTDNPCDIDVETGSTLEPLPDHPNMNYGGTRKSGFEICTFTVGTASISNLVMKAPDKSVSYADINDFKSVVAATNANGFIYLPHGLHIEFGKATADYVNSNCMRATVTWQNPFEAPPIVMAISAQAETSGSTLGENIKANQITTTGCNLYTTNPLGGVGATWHRTIHYVAIGK